MAGSNRIAQAYGYAVCFIAVVTILISTSAIVKSLFDLSDPLVCLAAVANLGIGLTYFVASGLGYGTGDVRAVTYEYGNAFLIVAGLLNLLVVIDAYDVALGRK